MRSGSGHEIMVHQKKREFDKMHLLDLPIELLTFIFSSLSIKCKINVALTCKTLRSIVYTKMMWHNVYAKLKLEHSEMKMMGKFKRFKTDSIQSWPGFVFTSFHERGIHQIIISSINHGRLRSDMELISKNMPRLSHLIYDKNVLQSSTEFIRSINQICYFNVVSLGLSFNSIVDAAVIKSIALSMPHIMFLTLKGCSQVNDTCAQHLSGFKNLELLDLCCTSVSDVGIALICGYKFQNGIFIHDESAPILSKLYGLNIDLCLKVTCNSWEFLRNLPSLTTLITGPSENATSSNIQHLAEMKCLLIKCYKMNKLLKLFSKRGCKLQSLCMPGFSIDDTGVHNFSKGFDHLIFLTLNSESITDVGVKVICHNLPQLIFLDLTACINITDQSLKCIGEKLLNLKYLCIIMCHRITSKGLFYIPPSCQVHSSEANKLYIADGKSLSQKSEIKKWLEALRYFSLLSITIW